VGPADFVLSAYGSDLLCVAADCAAEAARRGLALLEPGRQYLSLCLAGLCVTPAGFDADAARALAREVALLGGAFRRALTAETTVVVARRSASAKVYAAAAARLPVVGASWVRACFERRARAPLDAHRLRPFDGCVFTSSDLTAPQRAEAAALVAAGGGAWSGAYDEAVTFVVARRLGNSRKVALALAADVPVVTPEWLRTSAAAIEAPNRFVLNWWCVEDAVRPTFSGRTFEIASGVRNARLLVDVIIAHGGAASRAPDFLVADRMPEQAGATVVSPRWVWACVSENRLIDVDASVTFVPSPEGPPVPGVSNCAFVLMNLGDECRLLFADLLRDFGATVYFSFSKNAKLIIIQECDKRTLELAEDYSIPIVSVGWVVSLAKTGKAPDPDEFLVRTTGSHMQLKDLCKQLKRTSSRPQVELPLLSTRLRDLSSFSQVSPEVEKGPKVSYESSVPLVTIPYAPEDDPLIRAFETALP
jgi:hypothetical protein